MSIRTGRTTSWHHCAAMQRLTVARRRYYQAKLKKLRDSSPLQSYLSNPWNYLDWLAYILLFIYSIISVISATSSPS